MELTLQGKNLVFAKNGVFKVKYNSQFLFYEISSLKKNFFMRLYLYCDIGKFEVFNEKRRFFNVSRIGLVATKRTVNFRLR